MKQIARKLLYAIIFISFCVFVFWMCNHPFDLELISYKLTNFHEISFVDDILIHWWPTLVTTSFFLNYLAMKFLWWFNKGIRTGMIRVGGKSGND